MIHFYVCTRCNHNFQDKLLGTEAPVAQVSDLGGRTVATVIEVPRMDGVSCLFQYTHLFHYNGSLTVLHRCMYFRIKEMVTYLSIIVDFGYLLAGIRQAVQLVRIQ